MRNFEKLKNFQNFFQKFFGGYKGLRIAAFFFLSFEF